MTLTEKEKKQIQFLLKTLCTNNKTKEELLKSLNVHNGTLKNKTFKQLHEFFS